MSNGETKKTGQVSMFSKDDKIKSLLNLVNLIENKNNITIYFEPTTSVAQDANINMTDVRKASNKNDLSRIKNSAVKNNIVEHGAAGFDLGEVKYFSDERKDKIIEAYKDLVDFLKTKNDVVVLIDRSEERASAKIIENKTIEELHKIIERKKGINSLQKYLQSRSKVPKRKPESEIIIASSSNDVSQSFEKSSAENEPKMRKVQEDSLENCSKGLKKSIETSLRFFKNKSAKNEPKKRRMETDSLEKNLSKKVVRDSLEKNSENLDSNSSVAISDKKETRNIVRRKLQSRKKLKSPQKFMNNTNPSVANPSKEKNPNTDEKLAEESGRKRKAAKKKLMNNNKSFERKTIGCELD